MPNVEFPRLKKKFLEKLKIKVLVMLKSNYNILAIKVNRI